MDLFLYQAHFEAVGDQRMREVFAPVHVHKVLVQGVSRTRPDYLERELEAIQKSKNHTELFQNVAETSQVLLLQLAHCRRQHVRHLVFGCGTDTQRPQGL